MKLMKRVWAALLLLAASGQLYADEGMWVLKELNKQNLARMAELGFTPSYDQLYSETDPCVANAVVIFGGGCTGITVSNEGLIFTNHHCGFGGNGDGFYCRKRPSDAGILQRSADSVFTR